MSRSDHAPAKSDTAGSGAASSVVHLPIEIIQRDRAQARTHFDEAGLDELAESITQSGVIQPIVVHGDAEHGYRLIAGERRWRAAQRAGLAEMPAIVRNDLSADEAAVLGLIENLQRESLGVMDTAHGLARLGDTHGLTHEAIAHRIGKSRVYVTNFLRLRQLAPTVQTLLDEGRLSLGHGKVLAGLPASTQAELARRAIARHASVRQLERWAREAGPENQGPPPPDADSGADLGAMERGLSEHLGNTVAIRYEPNRRRGELRIAFHDLDEFEGLLARLGYRTN
ncbi:ParB/RepB/Spo0J family partition protein [Salinisphaera sp. Q1T1-3]|uniref:ParB/RepB/Spo0J family partition protein n=1 Tax=Salinisphaera sp. Q1T1-3 TaxID=2321229 RepID=UPI000E7319DF|nr:ParB/RepB/Spo0J family partition protein [Salinisphaera sp. Q1T1-3]RJS92891.1 ParB/RepB/Spo0J family partition protein [Salinisphaera sp. Q1T1-3]